MLFRSVDTDERPDVNARYNAGGWPTTAFLTSDGDVIAKTTYLDAEQMLEALHGIQESWLVGRDGLTREIEAARNTNRVLLGVWSLACWLAFPMAMAFAGERWSPMWWYGVFLLLQAMVSGSLFGLALLRSRIL